MKIIVGLGNCGKEFTNTRHNLGFSVIDFIAKTLKIEKFKENEIGFYSKAFYNERDFILLKPKMFINCSGNSIDYFIKKFKLNHKKILIIYDDITMPLGKIRFRKKGSSGGHNGIKSIISSIKSDEFDRIKVGVDYNQNFQLKDWVIGKFSENESIKIKKILPDILKLVLEWL